jgi:hypothetical protein
VHPGSATDPATFHKNRKPGSFAVIVPGAKKTRDGHKKGPEISEPRKRHKKKPQLVIFQRKKYQ